MPKVDMLSNEALIEEIGRRFNLEFQDDSAGQGLPIPENKSSPAKATLKYKIAPNNREGQMLENSLIMNQTIESKNSDRLQKPD